MKLRKILFVFISFLLTSPLLNAQSPIPSPDAYLGYELGSQFTLHNKVFGYFKEVAKTSPLVKYQSYGLTNEGRELGIAIVSSKNNLDNLEQIRLDNLKRTGLIDGVPSNNDIVIVWLSYNVHGNETSSSEAAIKTLFELVRPDNAQTKEWLRNTVVIMDPMMNPDGRDRYVQWYNEMVGEKPNAHSDAREHHEPWPGGRTNHYNFDLNRDWAFLTQKESQQRVKVYEDWLPQIHIDFHEMGYNSPYFFAPAAAPYHDAITQWQRDFQNVIGKNHAKYFDRNGWLYFTKETYDLFYPSYGDTYPIFNGAIGMTYEQGGGGGAGLAIEKADGDTLTLKDRMLHHYTTGISMVEVASGNAKNLVQEFTKFYEDGARNPKGVYKSFVIKNDSPNRVKSMLNLLDKHRVEYMRASNNGRHKGYNYKTGITESFNVQKGDIVISVYQPKAVLTRTLFEPEPSLPDSLTYDITAWAFPYAYGLNAFASTQIIDGVPFKIDDEFIRAENKSTGSPYAYLAKWNDFEDVKFLSALLKENIIVRFATKPFSLDKQAYKAGTLIITQTGNTNISDFDAKVQQAANNHNIALKAVTTGFVDSGPDFGSNSVRFIKQPKIALLSGTGTTVGSVGEIWHYFDQQIEYPITLLGSDYFTNVDLQNYDVLILPAGNYGQILGENGLNQIRNWVKKGGKLIAGPGAIDYLAGKDGFSLQRKSTEKDSTDEVVKQEEMLQDFGGQRRRSISDRTPGSIYSITMDNTHPLAFGYDTTYTSLKLSAATYEFLEDGWNVGVLKKNAHLSGFIGYKAKKKIEDTFNFGVQSMGRGTVVYMVDNPLFRAFWYNGKLLFGNAVFLVGQ